MLQTRCPRGGGKRAVTLHVLHEFTQGAPLIAIEQESERVKQSSEQGCNRLSKAGRRVPEERLQRLPVADAQITAACPTHAHSPPTASLGRACRCQAPRATGRPQPGSCGGANGEGRCGGGHMADTAISPASGIQHQQQSWQHQAGLTPAATVQAKHSGSHDDVEGLVKGRVGPRARRLGPPPALGVLLPGQVGLGHLAIHRHCGGGKKRAREGMWG